MIFRPSFLAAALVVMWTLNGGGWSAQAQTTATLTTLHKFAAAPVSEAALLQGSDGNFYGTTQTGGDYGAGTVFKLTPAGVLTTLHSFSGPDGKGPTASLIQPTDGNGDLLGTAYEGGAYGYGTVFFITTGGGFGTIHNFNRTDGAYPYANLIQGQDRAFYGTTVGGGANDDGTVFRVTYIDELTTLHSFTNDEGRDIYAGLVQASDGNFYTVSPHNNHNSSAAYRITPSGGTTVIHYFNGADGYFVRSALVEGSDGNLYGSSYEGGQGSGVGYGTIYKMTLDGVVTPLHTFSQGDGYLPNGPLFLGKNGVLYGTTKEGGGSGRGLIFQIKTDGTFAVLHPFKPADGTNPFSGLIEAGDGNFYGTTTAGGKTGFGTVYRIDPGGALSTIYNFYPPEGSTPKASLIEGTDGNFYGTASAGGPDNSGAVFQITPGGVLTTLHFFNQTDGSAPAAALIQARDGDFYGTTAGGGKNGTGTVFKMTPGGTLSTLHSFLGVADDLSNRDGANPLAALLQAGDGDFYGTTFSGGRNGRGTAFRLTPGGTLTNLHSFDGFDGQGPAAPLIQANGYLYGTTEEGGSSGNYGYGFGTIFKITTGGALTMLHSFNGTADGNDPATALIQARDGNFYGTTEGEPPGDGDRPDNPFFYGTAFQLTPDGTLNMLYDFHADGRDSLPEAPLIQGTDGNFYGTTGGSYYASPAGLGSVFQLTPTGTLTVLHEFSGDDGEFPKAGLIQAKDGNFYGTTSAGDGSEGTVFRLTLNTPAGSVQFSAPAYHVVEGVRTDNLSVPRTGGSTGAVSVRYATADGTALAGRDYRAAGGTLHWASGDTTAKIIPVQILDPGVSDNGTRTFTIGLTAPMGGVSIAANEIASVGIIDTAAPVITSNATASAEVGTPFAYQITATNSPTSFNAKGLPPGLSVDTRSGGIYDTPSAVGTFPVTLSATNIAGPGTATLMLTVQAQGTPLITSAETVTTGVGAAFSYRIAATNSPTSFGAQGLTDGLTIDAKTGVISGTPKAAGTLTLTLNAYNSVGKGSITLTVTVENPPVITSATTATTTVGQSFSYYITATNNPTKFGAQGLPPGYLINYGSGEIYATPKAAGKVVLTVNAYNSAAAAGSATLTVTVAAK